MKTIAIFLITILSVVSEEPYKIYYNNGYKEMQAGNYGLAISLFKKSFKLSPKFQTAYYLAYCFNNTNSCDSTILYCNEVRKLNAPKTSFYYIQSDKMIESCQQYGGTATASLLVRNRTVYARFKTPANINNINKIIKKIKKESFDKKELKQ